MLGRANTDYHGVDDDADRSIGCVDCACLMTSLKAIVAERGSILGRQVHDLSYKAVDSGVGNDDQ